MVAPKKYRNRKERLAAKKKYYEKNKIWINRNRREKRRIQREKKPKSNFKLCNNCGKKLNKNEKNFRYKSKKRKVLTFRSICRSCDLKIYKTYIKTAAGIATKKKANKKYKASFKGRAADKRYYDRNQPKLMKIYVSKRSIQRKINPHIKIRDNLSLRMRLALKEQNLTKKNTTSELVGCSIKFLKNYLENKFKPGMTWQNHGRFGWHIDHIKPCSKFNLSDPTQQKKCFHYSNLQPLWAKENIQKSNK
jgi:hypothetical protein